MSITNDANGNGARKNTSEPRNHGPKGMVLEPYANEILSMARDGKSMQWIAAWLAQAPRGVAITRQAVHQWIKARVRKLKRLNAQFAETGLSVQFQQWHPCSGPLSPQAVNGLDPPQRVVKQSARAIDAFTSQISADLDQRKSRDMSDFMVTEADMARGQNVFKQR